MKLYLNDTLRREKVEFIPKNPERVTLYVCGPTVYNYAHIGNARPVVVFDVLYRLLRHIYGEDHVVYARNITDVDDKINKKAMDEGVDISAITNKFADIYNADMAALNALPPTYQPRATDHMPDMVAMIEKLIERKAAYVTDDGEVLFRVADYDAGSGRYGKLSGRSLDDMIAGARVEVAENKDDAADFVLWKPSKPGEPVWPGPRNPETGEVLPGRPGWHIECSAMSEAVLNLPIDIHGGGQDLIFPHHTNEIAQSCATHGHDDPAAYARYWMHNGFLDMSGEKMSKSLGNVVLVHDLTQQYPGEVIRLALLSAHYRAPLDWNEGLLEQTRKRLDGFYGALLKVADVPAYDGLFNLHESSKAWGFMDEKLEIGVEKVKKRFSDFQNYKKNRNKSFLNWYKMGGIQKPPQDVAWFPTKFEAFVPFHFLEKMHDDLNFSSALAEISSLVGKLNKSNDWLKKIEYKHQLLAAANILGILQQDPEVWFKGGASDDLTAKVEALLVARTEARAAKNWAEADRIRDELNALKVEVMDSPSGATWKLKAGV